MFKHISLLFCVVTFFGFSAESFAVECRDLMAQAGSREFITELNGTIVTLHSVGLANREIQEVTEVIESLNSKVNGFIGVPPTLKMNVERASEEAIAKTGIAEGLTVINIPYQYQFSDLSEKQFIKHPRYTRYLEAHEYGHALLNFNLAKEIPNLPQIEMVAKKIRSERMKNLSKESEPLFQEYDNLKDQLSRDERYGRNSEIPTLRRKILEVRQKLEERFVPELNGFDMMEVLSRPRSPFDGYRELFSDVVAIIYSKDADAIEGALTFTGMSEGAYEQLVAPRIFVRGVEADTWTSYDVHNQLTPTRSFLLENYLRQPRYLNHGGPLLRALLEAIKTEIVSRYTQNLWDLTPKQVNERLQVEITKQMK